jgi:hypothetical protein
VGTVSSSHANTLQVGLPTSGVRDQNQPIAIRALGIIMVDIESWGRMRDSHEERGKSRDHVLDSSPGGSIATMIAVPSRVCSLLLCDLSEEEETSRRTLKSRTNGKVVTVSFTHANTLQIGLSTFDMRNQD